MFIDINFTKSETWAVSPISQDFSAAIDKFDTNFRSSMCCVLIFEQILIVVSLMVLEDNVNSLILFRIFTLFLKSFYSNQKSYMFSIYRRI